ncbi:putative protoporphyrin uptake protein 1 [Rosellinia necatrix]|uniref:Putative protoporphyrin uptake protein 1 n=1 Tax=Rosellinia necatrix TaxID=77044 RepID=A0A1S7UM97_ROSNE|nr:putative protoporphyrin uptake protein 1 [Rosellinia necatrix]
MDTQDLKNRIRAIDAEQTPDDPPTAPDPDPETDPKRAPRDDWNREFWGPWGWEIAAIVAAVSLSAATVAVLARYDGEVQPRWPYDVTLAALAALLATLIKSLVLVILEEVIGHSRWSWFRAPRPLYQLETLDQASRGPWGSLNYLVRVHRLHPSTIAAAVLVLSLGTSTFTQQAIRSVACVKADPTAVAWVRVAQVIDDYATLPDNIDAAATSALFRGERDDATTNTQSSFSCPSGNCTFGTTATAGGVTYSSLGICSKCVDVTPQMGYVVTDHVPSPLDGLPGTADPPPNRDFYCQWPRRNRTAASRLGPDTFIGAYRCDLSPSFSSSSSSSTSPGDSIVGSGSSSSCTPHGVSSSANFASYWTADGAEDDWDAAVTADPTFAARVGMVIVTLRGIPAGAGFPAAGACGIPWLPPAPQQQQQQQQQQKADTTNETTQLYAACWLYPCIKHYSGSVEGGRLRETVVGTTLLPLLRTDSEDGDRREGTVHGAYIEPCYVDGRAVNHSSAAPPLFTSGDYPPRDGDNDDDDGRATDLDCWYGLTGSVARLFGGAAPASTWYLGVPAALGQYWMGHLLGRPWYSEAGPDLADPFGAVAAGVDAVAATMTNALREVGNGTRGAPGRAGGAVWRAAVCAEVGWPWLALPAVVVLAAAYVLVHTVADGVRDPSPARTWKSSVLPLLYYGLEKEHQKGELETEHGLSHDAKRRKVCLQRDPKGGWGLQDNTIRPPGDS